MSSGRIDPENKKETEKSWFFFYPKTITLIEKLLKEFPYILQTTDFTVISIKNFFFNIS